MNNKQLLSIIAIVAISCISGILSSCSEDDEMEFRDFDKKTLATRSMHNEPETPEDVIMTENIEYTLSYNITFSGTLNNIGTTYNFHIPVELKWIRSRRLLNGQPDYNNRNEYTVFEPVPLSAVLEEPYEYGQIQIEYTITAPAFTVDNDGITFPTLDIDAQVRYNGKIDTVRYEGFLYRIPTDGAHTRVLN